MFSLVSNLSLMDDEKLDYIVKNNIQVSTSLDGPEDLHNMNRRFPDGNSYAETVRWIDRINEAYKQHGKADVVYRVEALPTITKAHLTRAKDLVDEYVARGMKAIFLRPINPFGFAVNTARAIGYDTDAFLRFYEEALDYIIELNLKGTQLVERFAAIFLTKILKADDPNYLDIRSPCGAGIGQLAYNYDGKGYTCDEGRMVARMGDEAFQIGNVMQDEYNDIVTHPTVRAMATASTLDSIPSCATCAYRPYCGTCPVVNYRTQGSIFPQNPTNEKCKLHMGILDILFKKLIEADPAVMEIFDRWVTVRERPEYYVHDEIAPLEG
jgi:His-Xaa-Ser system radical SAM maturase HxsB